MSKTLQEILSPESARIYAENYLKVVPETRRQLREFWQILLENRTDEQKKQAKTIQQQWERRMTQDIVS